MNVLIIASLLLCCWIEMGYGIQCYECSGRDPGCEDPFNATSSLVNCALNGSSVCFKIKGTDNTVDRGCDWGSYVVSDEQKKQGEHCVYNRDGGDNEFSCFCLRDKCNHATLIGLELITGLLSFVMLMWINQ